MEKLRSVIADSGLGVTVVDDNLTVRFSSSQEDSRLELHLKLFESSTTDICTVCDAQDVDTQPIEWEAHCNHCYDDITNPK